MAPDFGPPLVQRMNGLRIVVCICNSVDELGVIRRTRFLIISPSALLDILHHRLVKWPSSGTVDPPLGVPQVVSENCSTQSWRRAERYGESLHVCTRQMNRTVLLVA